MKAEAVNPSLADGSGIYAGSILQSITSALSLGVQSTYQSGFGGSYLSSSYMARLASKEKDLWNASATYTPTQGVFEGTYWHRLSPVVEAGATLQAINQPGQQMAIATLGAKYNLSLASFRTHLDSTGKVAAYLEQRINPLITLVRSSIV